MLPGGQRAANGFQALSQYDRNQDGVIDARDQIWSRLRVAVWENTPRGEALLGDPAEAMNLRTLAELTEEVEQFLLSGAFSRDLNVGVGKLSGVGRQVGWRVH